MTYRPAGPVDVEALADLRRAFLAEAVAADPNDPALNSALRRFFTTTLNDGSFHAILAVDEDGRVVATSGLVVQLRPPSPPNLLGREAYVMNRSRSTTTSGHFASDRSTTACPIPNRLWAVNPVASASTATSTLSVSRFVVILKRGGSPAPTASIPVAEHKESGGPFPARRPSSFPAVSDRVSD